MDPRILFLTKEPKRIPNKFRALTGLSIHLLDLEPRIRVFGIHEHSVGLEEIVGDFCSYFPMKDYILIPFEPASIEHEIAHMVEMNDFSRLVLPDWGLHSDVSNKKMSILISASSREARVRAIQAHLYPSGVKFEPIWDHPFWGNVISSRLEKESIGRLKSFQDYKNWIDDLQMKTFMTWSPERIEFEWIKRLNFIRNWMETK